MAEHPLKIFETIDPDLFKLVRDTNSFALADGALPRKVKFLIAMALDAAHGTAEGTKALAEQAMKAGATRDEIVETIRVAQYISGVGSVYVAARALKELF
jgi:alkylhydroperoxidase/carboxymuconolactone decarboxylase family protein YurZ